MGIYTDAVQKLYVSYVNRPADPAGLAYWESQIAAQNGNTEVLARAFATSQEYLGYNDGLTTTEVIKLVYLNLFGRAAENDGLQYWVSMLDSQKMKIDNVVTVIGNSAQGWDLQAFNAKLAAANVFTNALVKATDILNYNGANANTIARNYLAGVVDTASLDVARQHIAETIASLEVNDESPFYPNRLHLGPDHITGSAGADRFIGGSNGNGLNFSHDDVLDGGDGQDILSIGIANNQPYVTPANVSVKNIELISISGANTSKVDTTDWQGVKVLDVSGKGDSTLKAAASTNIVAALAIKEALLNVDGGHDITLNLTNVSSDPNSYGNQIKLPQVFVGNKLPATGTVTITADSEVPMSGYAYGGKINVVGGTSVNIVQTESGSRNYYERLVADVSITGTDITTSVSAIAVRGLAPAKEDEKVLISDVHAGSSTQLGTISKVTLAGHNSSEIRDNALSDLILRDMAGTALISNTGLTQGAVQTLALSLENVDGSILDNNVYTKVNLTLPHGATTNSSILHALAGSALETLVVAGDAHLQLADNFFSDSLKELQVSGKVVLTALNLDKLAKLASVDLSANSANSTVRINPTHTSFSGGSGEDILHLTDQAPINKAIDLGAGNDSLTLASQASLPTAVVNGGAGTDTLTMTWWQIKSLAADPGFSSVFQNFEILEAIGSDEASTVDLAKFAGFTGVKMLAGTVTNLPNNGVLIAPRGSIPVYKIDSPAFADSDNDSVTLDVHTYDYGGSQFTVANVEHLNLKVSDDSGYAFGGAVIVNDVAAQSLNVSGDVSTQITLNSTALTQVDARQFTGMNLTLSLASKQTALSVLGGTHSNTTIDLSKFNGALSYSGGSGNDRITLGGGANNISVGTGGDIVSLTAAGKDSSTFTTITDAHRGLRIGLPEMGHVTFNASKLTLDSDASLQNYLDSVIVTRGNASHDAAGGWFQYQGNTYVVQSRHDAAQVTHFVNGTDFIVKLTGLIDLTNAHLTPNNVLTIV